MTGRQLARVSAPDYREVLLSWLYPGSQSSLASLQPVMQEVAQRLALSRQQRQRTLIYMDGGFGDDANLNWLLHQDYQVIAKGYSGKRAAAFARRVHTWQEVIPGQRWLAWSPRPLPYARPTRVAVVRWLDQTQQFRHALLLTTLLDLSLGELARLYDQRAQVEVEIQADKSGLLLARRRKKHWHAQEMLILLNDWAHNFLAWFHAYLLRGTSLESFGPKRIVRDLFSIPAEIIVMEESLCEVRLQRSHPFAHEMVACLERLWRFPLP